MVHPATRRAVSEALRTLNHPVDLGLVYPPKENQERGRGIWTKQDLDIDGAMSLLSRAAAANAQGAAVFIRLGPSARTAHPGIVLVDDLAQDGVDALKRDGLEPLLVTETSPGNFQAWVRLTASGKLPYRVALEAGRLLAARYQGDPRAVSPMQPGRLPGFTNRKPKHQLDNGRFPFVRLVEANKGLVATRGYRLIDEFFTLASATPSAQRGRGPRAARETPPVAAVSGCPEGTTDFKELDRIFESERCRILDEVQRGTRPVTSASPSEIDYAVARAALASSMQPATIMAWLSVRRPDKHPGYASRTVEAAWSKLGAGRNDALGPCIAENKSRPGM